MSTFDLPDELVIEGVARAAERVLFSSNEFAERVADRILERLELLTPTEAAAVLGVSERRLGEVHKAWGLDKSVALGFTNPRYFLSQVLARMREKVVKGNGAVPAAAQRQTPNFKLQTLNGHGARKEVIGTH